MKNKNSLIFLLITTIFFHVSCSEKKTAQKHFTHELILKDSIRILNLPQNNFIAYSTHVVDSGGKTYLLRDDHFSNSFLIYDWDNKKLHKVIKFDLKGPHGVINVSSPGKYLFTLDSVLMIGVRGLTVITKGNKVKYRRKNIVGDEIYRSYGLNPFKPKGMNNSIFFWRAADYKINDKKYYERPLYFKFDLQKRNFTPVDIYFPPFFKGKIWNHFQANTYLTRKDNDLIIGFGATPVLYVFDMKKEKVMDTIHPPYGSFPKQVEPVLEGKNEAARLKRSFFYRGIEYDPYRKVFYRFMFVPVPETIQVVDKFDFWTTMPFIIQVLDENFNLIAERKFKGRFYNLRDYFVTKEGLWISVNNPDNPGFDEDQLKFYLFRLQEKK